VNTYYTLGFSSFTTDLQTSCTYFANGSPNFLIYEPVSRPRGELYLPSLSSVSDIPNENEFITLPGRGFLVYAKDPETKNDTRIHASRLLDAKCDNGVPSRWIGLTDITGATSTNSTLRQITTDSGGKRRNKITRKY
jgi:hypothetical protein